MYRHARTSLHLTAVATVVAVLFGSPLAGLFLRPPMDEVEDYQAMDVVERVAHFVPAPDTPAVDPPQPDPSPESAPEVVPEPEPEPVPPPALAVAAEAPDAPAAPPVEAVPVAIKSEQPVDPRLAAKRARKRARRAACRPDVPEIEATGVDRYRVERDLVDRYTKRIKDAYSLAYVTWARDRADRVIGFKVKKIRCGSVLFDAGFRNGDVITAVNGRRVTTIAQALLAYRKLRTKRRLDVDLVRRGQERSIRYDLS